MNFHSDHVVGAHPKVMEALVAANQGSVPSYGNDPVSAALEEDLAVLFGREVRVFMTPTGTAANALSLAALTPRWGTIYAHSEAHVEMDECAAPEFYTGGAKLSLVPGDHGRMDLDQLAARLAAAPRGFVHATPPIRSGGRARSPASRACGCIWTARVSPMPACIWAWRRPRSPGMPVSTC